MADQPHAEASAAKAPGSNKLMLIVGILVAAGASGGGTYVLTRPKEAPPGQEAKVASKAKAPSHEGAEEEDDGEEGAAEEEGGKEHPVVNLPPFLVNLGDDFNEPHYLKVSVAVEVEGEGEEASKGFEGKSARVRGAVLLYLSGLKLEDVQGQENRKKIVTGVRKEVRKSAGRKLVRDVFITEMVVQ